MPSHSIFLIDPNVTLRVVGGALGAFCFLMLLHVAVWRIFKVKKQILWLFIIFLGLPTAALLFGLRQEFAAAVENELALCYVFLITISASYVLAYPAAQAASPSMVMMLLLDEGKKNGGMTREEIISLMRSDNLFENRIRDLDNDGLFRNEDIRPGLSPAGRIIAMVFFYYRRLLKLPRGRG